MSKAAAAIREGCAVVVIDDTTPVEHSALVLAAEHATTKLIAFVIRHTGGFVCVALGETDCERLGLPQTAPSSATRCRRQRVTVDAKDNGTGISAAARARTLRALADPGSTTTDFTRPGHVVPVGIPLRGPDEGVDGADFAEASIAIAELAGCSPVGAYAVLESVEHPTEVADAAESERFARRYGLNAVRLSDCLSWPLSTLR
ncbi:3,4-dihydroxy-2-butanone-4-phosphate synthase [Gordonia sp. GONU]|uniref:3,4-dihydroxy-2-butanone-4-phosphate synthase n=1 Tax=Gordonia sp. GONU TaxID=2972949 RepID=UPI0021ABF7E0|nr:3,4-dihydroxy-2-butanone-4-phosphate synthase [Gordonia sp. GONU]MCR8898064.1 3,4-dihydroxy-2-butanone-4-phosphate synthase [Gordonia sp. GONU]